MTGCLELLDGLGHLPTFRRNPGAFGSDDSGRPVFEALGDFEHCPLVAKELLA
jgi:hypothetical protein